MMTNSQVNLMNEIDELHIYKLVDNEVKILDCKLFQLFNDQPPERLGDLIADNAALIDKLINSIASPSFDKDGEYDEFATEMIETIERLAKVNFQFKHNRIDFKEFMVNSSKMKRQILKICEEIYISAIE
jgi:hypothetical protein